MSNTKWYFATNNHGLKNAFDQMQSAVRSAAANTSLVPVCIVDDEGADQSSVDKINWMEENGVKIFRHRSSFLSELVPVFGEKMNIYSGHWLRCDIPLIETEDEFVLYTDIDVVFLQDVAKSLPRPSLMSCGPEHHRDDYSYFNSGVVVMNVPAFAQKRDALLAELRNRLSTTAPYDDQSLLNDVFKGEWDRLPNEWNWKPYWGRNDDAAILHFHGPKPNLVRQMQAGDEDRFGNDFKTIFNRDKEGYAYYLPVFDGYQ